MVWLIVNNASRRGQTLIESIIALALFSLISASLVSLLLGGTSSSLEGTEHVHADALAQEGIEAARSIRDRAWNELRYTSSGVSTSSDQWVFDGEGTSTVFAPYTRQITVSPVCRSAGGDIVACPGASTDLDTLYVSSNISWRSSGGADLIRSRSSYFTNWDSQLWTQTDWSGGSGQVIWTDSAKYDSDNGAINRSSTGHIELAPLASAGTWSLVLSPLDDERLNGLSAVSATDIWAVGESGKIIHYDGVSWIEIADVGSVDLLSIAMVSATDGWAVGSSGKIYHYNGTTWSQFTDVGSQNLNSISMLSSTYGWIVGGNGEIYHYNGASWSSVTSPVTQQLNAVQVLSSTDAWIGGDSGKFLHYNGTSWSEIADLGGNNVESISLLSTSSGWGGGQNGEIYRYDGTSWTIFVDTGNQVWHADASLSLADGWMLGTGGEIRRWNGSVWNVFATPTQNDLRDVTMLTAQNGWAVGVEGTIVHYVAGPSGYMGDGSLMSSAFFLGDVSPVQALSWDQTVPSCTPACYVRLQLRTAPDAGGAPGVYTPWYGASGEGTYFTNASGSITPVELNGKSWVQYRAELHGDGLQTPLLQEVRLNYK